MITTLGTAVPALPEPARSSVLGQQLNYLCRFLLAPLCVQPFGALLLMLIVGKPLPGPWLLLWLAGHALVAGTHFVLVWRQLRGSSKQLPTQWQYRGHVMLACLHGLLWGSSMWLFPTDPAQVRTLLLLTCLVTISAANMFVYSAFRLTALGIAATLWLPVITWLLLHDLPYWALGIILFVMVQLLFNMQAYTIMLGELLERQRKTEALQQLDLSNQALDRSNRELAMRNEALQEAMVQVQHLAHFDSLTGVPNRRTFVRQLHQRLERGEPGFLVIMDMDRFQAVNDDYGQQTGDEMLQQFGQLLGRSRRDGELYARLGGAAFALLLQESTLLAVQRRLDVLCRGIHDYAAETTRPLLTFSTGVTLLSEYEPLENAIARAEAAVRRAKSNGRNRVELG